MLKTGISMWCSCPAAEKCKEMSHSDNWSWLRRHSPAAARVYILSEVKSTPVLLVASYYSHLLIVRPISFTIAIVYHHRLLTLSQHGKSRSSSAHQSSSYTICPPQPLQFASFPSPNSLFISCLFCNYRAHGQFRQLA